MAAAPYDDEDGVWLARDTLPQSDPTRVATEPRLAQMYSFNFGDPMRFRDGDGQNPLGGAALGAGLETARQIFFEDKMDYGRIAAAGAAGATGTYFFGRIAAFGGATNVASAGIVSLVTSDAIMKLYDGNVMTPGEFAMDVSVAVIAHAVLAKGAQAFGVDDALFAPLAPPIRPPVDGGLTTVYRIEGTVNQRLTIDAAGNVSVQGQQVLFLNFGDAARAEQFLKMRISQGMEDATVKSFQVPTSYLHKLQSTAVPEAIARQFPFAPLVVDVSKGANQFGLRPSHVEELKKMIVAGSGKQ